MADEHEVDEGPEFSDLMETFDSNAEKWKVALRNEPGELSTKAQVRNWIQPQLALLRQALETALEGLEDQVEDALGELTERVDEVSTLARSVAGSVGMLQVLAAAHEVARRVVAGDVGQETVELAEGLAASLGGMPQVLQAEAERQAEEAALRQAQVVRSVPTTARPFTAVRAAAPPPPAPKADPGPADEQAPESA